MNRISVFLSGITFFCLLASVVLAQTTPVPTAKNRSHPPMRPMPQPSGRAFADGASKFVDANRGDDAAAGTEQAPWSTLRHAVRQLNPGDTLYLRGGTYY